MSEKIRFPDGREVELHELIAFLYGVSRSDVEVLHVLMAKDKKMYAEELANELHVTKASISKSINNLMYKGLINRDKVNEQGKQKGRPNYIYWVDKEQLYKKIVEDLERLVKTAKEELLSHLQVVTT